MIHERQKGFAKISPQERFARAREKFSDALISPQGKFSGPELTDAFLDVEHTLFLLPGVPSEEKTTTLLDLAAQGEGVAMQRGYPGTVASMRFFQERIQDAAAIEKGEYPLVEVRRDHGEQYGAPETITPIYQRPDGQKVAGEASAIREGIGVNGGIITLHPNETSSNLSPYRRLPRRS